MPPRNNTVTNLNQAGDILNNTLQAQNGNYGENYGDSAFNRIKDYTFDATFRLLMCLDWFRFRVCQPINYPAP
jgi:hypothetical protein